MLCTTSPSAENLISRIFRNSAARSAAELRPGIGSGSRTEQLALDDAANGVCGHEIDLLNDRGLLGGRRENVVAMSAHLVRAGAGEADGDQAELTRCPQCREHVRRASRGRDGQEHVAAPAEPA